MSLSLDEFSELVERARIPNREAALLRLVLGVDDEPVSPRRAGILMGVSSGWSFTAVRRARDRISKLPVHVELPPATLRRKVATYHRPPRTKEFMTVKDAERIIGGSIGVGEPEGGYVRVACVDAFGKTLSEVARNVPAALELLIRSNYARSRQFVFERDGYRCTNCGGFKNLQADHVRARSHGRYDHPDNLTTLCAPCHEIRHRRSNFH
jgi:hypothetical protein